RAAALQNMQHALDEKHIAGPKSNINFLRTLVRHPAFKAGKVNTHFIADHHHALLPEKTAPAPETLALATLGLMEQRTRHAGLVPTSMDAGTSPAWRAND